MLIEATPFIKRTGRTITDPAAFARHLQTVREQGWALDDEEDVVGIRCVAAPVFGYTGHVVGSMCALGPKNRMTRTKLRNLRKPLFELSRAFSEKLGWRGE